MQVTKPNCLVFINNLKNSIENNHGENLSENKITLQYLFGIFCMSKNARDSRVAILLYHSNNKGIIFNIDVAQSVASDI